MEDALGAGSPLPVGVDAPSPERLPQPAGVGGVDVPPLSAAFNLWSPLCPLLVLFPFFCAYFSLPVCGSILLVPTHTSTLYLESSGYKLQRPVQISLTDQGKRLTRIAEKSRNLGRRLPLCLAEPGDRTVRFGGFCLFVFLFISPLCPFLGEPLARGFSKFQPFLSPVPHVEQQRTLA